LLFTLFVTWPVVEAAYYSFFNWNGYRAPSKWIGLENFCGVLNDPIFYHSLFNNLLIVLVSAFIQVPMAQALHKELCRRPVLLIWLELEKSCSLLHKLGTACIPSLPKMRIMSRAV
jgi:hypothetical protein